MSNNTRKMGGHSGTRPALKGNLALKSSPLNPSSGKSVTQDLVIDHMNAHYRKLLNAKSAIDASVPKAYSSSQKVRDRHTRNEILTNGKRSASAGRPMSAQGSRPNSARPSRPGSARNIGGTRKPFDTQTLEPFQLEDVDYGNFTQDEINCINAMVNDTIDSERLDRVLNGDSHHPPGKGTARSGGSGSGGQRTSRGMVEAMNMNTLQRKTMSADILEKRTHVFTEPKDSFTPRTLRNPKYKDVPSKLSQTKHFRPAKKGTSPPVNNQRGYAQSATESEMLDETLMSRDFSTRLTMSGAVPKLDISIDQDHMKWLQEQSARKESKAYRPLEEELAVMGQERKPPTRANSGQTRATGGQARTTGGYTRTKIQREEEELSYLDFITEVTNDVLTRGIFTNRVLCNVFEEHVQKNKQRLDEDRMRGMLDNLRDDLGIPSHEPFRENPDDVGMGSSRPAVRSKTKTTGYTGDASQFRNVRVGDTDKAKAYGDVGDSYRPLDGGQQMELQSLTDIAEVSEKTASVSSIKSSSRKPPAQRAASKEMDNALIDLLGLEDTTDAPLAVNIQNGDEPAGVENFSVKSTLSSHTSERLSNKSADPLQAYADSLAQDNADRASVRSAASRASKTSTLKGGDHSRPAIPRQNSSDDSTGVPKPFARKISAESLSKSSVVQKSSASHSRKSSADSGARSNLSRQSSADLVGDARPSISRQSSKDSMARSNADLGQTKAVSSRQATGMSTLPHGSDEGEDLDLESNVDFGKTTLFGKTRDLGLTYKALSQASDEDDVYSDNFSDRPYHDDDNF